MDLKQKYIRDDKKQMRVKCKFDDAFIDDLLKLPYTVGMEIMVQIGRCSHKLPFKNHWPQQVAGVVKGESPFFFLLEYVRNEGKHAIFVDMLQIDCDTYLDYMNNKKVLK
tara:strand:+ start:8065 stop:8394 length:330 start_codon:yes stop_codon:yes gene_type:complete